MFETRKGEVSEFTQRALEGRIKEVGEVAGFSKSELYRILAGQAADRLDDARDLHRGLCVHNPKAAREYRDLLASDAELMTPRVREMVEEPDDLAVKRLCDEMTTALLGDEESKASAMRKLHALLGARLRTVYRPDAHLRNVG